jgi:5-methylcytosine-specific restriction endonuclease McrA
MTRKKNILKSTYNHKEQVSACSLLFRDALEAGLNKNPVIIADKASTANDAAFYKFVWDNGLHYCENCGIHLADYSASYISHIKTRGAHTELRYNIGNVNILCLECHSKWEFSPAEVRNNMFIYHLNHDRQ